MIWVIFGSMLVLLCTHFLAYAIGRHLGFRDGYETASLLYDREMEHAVKRWRNKIAHIRSLYSPDTPPETNTNSESSKTSSDCGSLGQEILNVQRILTSSTYGLSTSDRVKPGIHSNE